MYKAIRSGRKIMIDFNTSAFAGAALQLDMTREWHYED